MLVVTGPHLQCALRQACRSRSKGSPQAARKPLLAPNPLSEGEGAKTMLETTDLTIRFGGHVAVDHVSCRFEPGTLV